MEVLRDIKITIEIDTNKATYTETFANMEDAEAWCRDHIDAVIGG